MFNVLYTYGTSYTSTSKLKKAYLLQILGPPTHPMLLFFLILTDSFFASKNLLISSSEHSYERLPRYTVYGGLLGRRLRSIWRAWDARGAEGRTLRSKILSDDGFSPGQLVVISNGGKRVQYHTIIIIMPGAPYTIAKLAYLLLSFNTSPRTEWPLFPYSMFVRLAL